jgi:hypothetical protein
MGTALIGFAVFGACLHALFAYLGYVEYKFDGR